MEEAAKKTYIHDQIMTLPKGYCTSQIIDSDQIYVMKAGSVVKSGTHEKLYRICAAPIPKYSMPWREV